MVDERSFLCCYEKTMSISMKLRRWRPVKPEADMRSVSGRSSSSFVVRRLREQRAPPSSLVNQLLTRDRASMLATLSCHVGCLPCSYVCPLPTRSEKLTEYHSVVDPSRQGEIEVTLCTSTFGIGNTGNAVDVNPTLLSGGSLSGEINHGTHNQAFLEPSNPITELGESSSGVNSSISCSSFRFKACCLRPQAAKAPARAPPR